MIQTFLRLAAGFVLTLLIVYLQDPLYQALLPRHDGGVIAASLVGRFLTMVVLLAATAFYVVPVSIFLGGAAEAGVETEGCLRALGLLAFNLLGFVALNAMAVGLTWQVGHGIGACVVAFVCTFMGVGALLAGTEAGEAAIGMIAG